MSFLSRFFRTPKSPLQAAIAPSDIAERAAFSVDGSGRIPYRFGRQAADSTCYVTLDGAPVATFETMHYSQSVLHVEHFATDGRHKGKQLGEPCLRRFALALKAANPTINAIEFDLGRIAGRATLDDVLKLAHARYDLLKALGADDVIMDKPNATRIVVKGRWRRLMW